MTKRYKLIKQYGGKLSNIFINNNFIEIPVRPDGNCFFYSILLSAIQNNIKDEFLSALDFSEKEKKILDKFINNISYTISEDKVESNIIKLTDDKIENIKKYAEIIREKLINNTELQNNIFDAYKLLKDIYNEDKYINVGQKLDLTIELRELMTYIKEKNNENINNEDVEKKNVIEFYKKKFINSSYYATFIEIGIIKNMLLQKNICFFIRNEDSNYFNIEDCIDSNNILYLKRHGEHYNYYKLSSQPQPKSPSELPKLKPSETLNNWTFNYDDEEISICYNNNRIVSFLTGNNANQECIRFYYKKEGKLEYNYYTNNGYWKNKIVDKDNILPDNSNSLENLIIGKWTWIIEENILNLKINDITLAVFNGSDEREFTLKIKNKDKHFYIKDTKKLEGGSNNKLELGKWILTDEDDTLIIKHKDIGHIAEFSNGWDKFIIFREGGYYYFNEAKKNNFDAHEYLNNLNS